MDKVHVVPPCLPTQLLGARLRTQAFETLLTLECHEPGRRAERPIQSQIKRKSLWWLDNVLRNKRERKQAPEHVYTAGTILWWWFTPREAFAGFLFLLLSCLPNWHHLPSAFSAQSLTSVAQLIRNGFWFCCSYVDYAHQH